MTTLTFFSYQCVRVSLLYELSNSLHIQKPFEAITTVCALATSRSANANINNLNGQNKINCNHKFITKKFKQSNLHQLCFKNNIFLVVTSRSDALSKPISEVFHHSTSHPKQCFNHCLTDSGF